MLFAGDSDINKAMYDDRNRLAMALNNLKRNFNYLDYVVIVDRENRILASSSPYLLYPDGSAVKSWLQQHAVWENACIRRSCRA